MTTNSADRTVQQGADASCRPAQPGCSAAAPAQATPQEGPLDWFRDMVGHCLAYVESERSNGRHVVGITCEYTPRELIMAAGGIPVCLCGGYGEMIPPAEESLPANLCPLIKSTFGFSLEKANPFLEMAKLVVTETTCDGKKKMYELLAETRPVHVLELPQKPDDPGALQLWTAQLRELKGVLEERLSATITDDSLRAAIVEMNRARALRRTLAEMMKADDPPLSGRELLDMNSLIAAMPENLQQYERAISILPGRKVDPPPGERVRVLLTGVPIPHGAERVVDIIEENGGLLVCQENCTGLKPIMDDVQADAPDPLSAIAAKYFRIPCSVMTPNRRRFDSLRHLVAEYRPHCVIELVWQTCITYDVESFFVKRMCEEELDLPYLKIETDYSPSDSARIAMRVQALFETLEDAYV